MGNICSYCQIELDATWEYCPCCKRKSESGFDKITLRLHNLSTAEYPIIGKRKIIFERDGYKCLACGTTKNLTKDHIIPKALGGNSEVDNLQTLCFKCNGEKGKRIRDYRAVALSLT